jgi:hypothetical protein
MAHRGRLNVLVNVVKKPYMQVFSEFKGSSFKPDDVQGSGDVKYHLGTSTDVEIEGRKVLFVAGQNDDRLLVRKGGRRFGYVVTDVDPASSIVKRESLMPITEIGFSQVLDRTIRTLQQDVAADPSGDNTIVEHITTATINGRPCQMLRITHPRRRDGLQFFSASMAIDSALHGPVRFDVYDWPETPDQQPPLMSEFTYTNVTLNAELDDTTFAAARLRGP